MTLDTVKAWFRKHWQWVVAAVLGIIALLKLIILRPEPPAPKHDAPSPDDVIRTAEGEVRAGAADTRAAEEAAARAAANAAAAGKLDTKERELAAATPAASSSADAANAYADAVNPRRPS